MKKKTLLTALASCAGMLVLILDGKTALLGAQEGVMLCMKTLVPSLFPFFVLSAMLTGSLSGCSSRLLRPLGRCLHIPEGAEVLLAVGLLGGYPVGAQNIADACRTGLLDRDSGARMLAFCNNAGPAFLFGVVGGAFCEWWVSWALWGIHILSALFVAAVLPAGRDTRSGCVRPAPIGMTEALSRAVRVMALVCGWVVLFRMLLCFLARWGLWALPVSVQVALSGLLELSNGCVLLTKIPCAGLRFAVASGMLALGGLCVTMQTASVSESVSMACYYPGKLLQGSVSVALALLCQPLFDGAARCHASATVWSILLVFAGLSVFILRTGKKRDSICGAVGV